MGRAVEIGLVEVGVEVGLMGGKLGLAPLVERGCCCCLLQLVV